MSAPRLHRLVALAGLPLAGALLLGCGGSPCGPTRGVVDYVIDGDTIVLESGETIRYLLVDTPETTKGKNDCYGKEATAFNLALVQGREVSLAYSAACTDKYDRTLAYVSVEGVDVNAELVSRGFGCVLHIPPAGEERVEEFRDLQDAARSGGRGLWSACGERPKACGD